MSCYKSVVLASDAVNATVDGVALGAQPPFPRLREGRGQKDRKERRIKKGNLLRGLDTRLKKTNDHSLESLRAASILWSPETTQGPEDVFVGGLPTVSCPVAWRHTWWHVHSVPPRVLTQKDTDLKRADTSRLKKRSGSRSSSAWLACGHTQSRPSSQCLW